MINHFKAEFYKLRHSKILITILGVCAAVIMVSFALGDMTFFGAGDGTESVIGFQAKCYLSSEIPTFQTVARSSLAYTAFFWIIGILFATIFFTKEYNTGTIKLSVAYGTKRTILYYTKAITILVVSLITYLIFVATFFVIEIIQSGYIPTASEVINLFGMGSCLRNGFISIRKHFYFFMCRYSKYRDCNRDLLLICIQWSVCLLNAME